MPKGKESALESNLSLSQKGSELSLEEGVTELTEHITEQIATGKTWAEAFNHLKASPNNYVTHPSWAGGVISYSPQSPDGQPPRFFWNAATPLFLGCVPEDAFTQEQLDSNTWELIEEATNV